MELKITQLPAKGFFGGPHNTDFTIQIESTYYTVAIEQLLKRSITVSSEQATSMNKVLEVYYTLETFLMLCDGQFYPAKSAFENGIDITQSWKERTLPSYQSADYMSGTGNALLDFDMVLDSKVFKKWFKLRRELDLIHKMVLYCLSDVKMPKDMQCAFMTEAFIGVAELIHKRRPEFLLPSVSPDGSKLKYYLLAVIDHYGSDIFLAESSIDKDEFAQILVNTRNRIAHIKSKQNRIYLDGGESVMYLAKLSLLYRIVLFSLLGFSKSLYNDKLIKRVHAIDNHDSTKGFLVKLSKVKEQKS